MPKPSSKTAFFFEQPLFLSERIAADWKLMYSQITSATQLEAAYRVVEPQVTAMDLALTDADRQQCLTLYNKAVVDGRYVEQLMTDPKGVAQKLGVELSATAQEALKQLKKIEALLSLTEGSPRALPMVIVICVVIASHPMCERLVIDSSGVVKL